MGITQAHSASAPPISPSLSKKHASRALHKPRRDTRSAMGSKLARITDITALVGPRKNDPNLRENQNRA